MHSKPGSSSGPPDPLGHIQRNLSSPPPGTAGKQAVAMAAKTGKPIWKVCLMVKAQSGETRPGDLRSSYVEWVAKPDIFAPTPMAWRLEAPTNQHYFLVFWMIPNRNSQTQFERFCSEQRREWGVLGPEMVAEVGGVAVRVADCRLIHEDDIIAARPRKPPSVKTIQTRARKAAQKLLTSRSDASEELEAWEFRSESEAHDDAVPDEQHAQADASFEAAAAALAADYGEPWKSASGQHPDLPHAVERWTIWKVLDRTLYLVVSHEDRELPVTLIVGILKPAKLDVVEGRQQAERATRQSAGRPRPTNPSGSKARPKKRRN